MTVRGGRYVVEVQLVDQTWTPWTYADTPEEAERARSMAAAIRGADRQVQTRFRDMHEPVNTGG